MFVDNKQTKYLYNSMLINIKQTLHHLDIPFTTRPFPIFF